MVCQNNTNLLPNLLFVKIGLIARKITFTCHELLRKVTRIRAVSSEQGAARRLALEAVRGEGEAVSAVFVRGAAAAAGQSRSR